MNQISSEKIETRKYPYQNTALVNLTQEEWKDIPGFEGYYQISNCGTI
jgi:hypothetical protein